MKTNECSGLWGRDTENEDDVFLLRFCPMAFAIGTLRLDWLAVCCQEVAFLISKDQFLHFSV